MKLVIAVVNTHDARSLSDALIESGFQFTEIGSTGGFLRQGNVTLLIGSADEQVETVVGLIRQHCEPRDQAVNVSPPDTRMYADPVGEALTVSVGGAQLFVLNVEDAIRI
jgi:uncharacterized protein YaaQ